MPNAALVALALQVMGGAGVGDAATIAPAIVQAVEWRAAHGLPPASDSPTLDVVLLAVYARHESSARLHPAPESWDALALVSCGPWQMKCGVVGWPWEREYSPALQARTWLGWVSSSSLAQVDSSKSRARRRLAEARDALRGAI